MGFLAAGLLVGLRAEDGFDRDLDAADFFEAP
jgi:hypothetical protein